MLFSIEVAALLPALKLAAPLAGKNSLQRYREYYGARIVAEDGGDAVTLSVNSGDAMISVSLPAGIVAGGAICVDAAALLNIAKANAKGGILKFETPEGAETIAVGSGRASYSLASLPVDTFPVHLVGDDFEAVDLSDAAALVCGVEGFDAPAEAVAFFGKAVALCNPKPKRGQEAVTVAPEVWTHTMGVEHGQRVMITAAVGPWSLVANCHAPQFAYKSARASKFAHRLSDTGYSDALAYLSDLADRRGFDITGQNVALEIRDGAVMGATFGERTEWPKRAGDWIYVEGTPEQLDAQHADRVERYGPGVNREEMLHVQLDRDVPQQYAAGSFSVVMPRENAAMAAAVAFSQQAEDGTWSDWVSVATTAIGALDWDSLPAMADLFALPAAETPVEAIAAVEAPKDAAAVESLCAPAGDAVPVAIEAEAPAPVVADAFADRLAELESRMARVEARPVYQGEGRPVRSEREANAVRRAWRMRGEARAARAELATERAEIAEATRDGVQHIARALNRGDRLARVAIASRTARRRLADDLRGARAEARALSRRVEEARSAGKAIVPASLARHFAESVA